MLDLSRMKSVRVDSIQRTTRAEGGLPWGAFDHETQTFGLELRNGRREFRKPFDLIFEREKWSALADDFRTWAVPALPDLSPLSL